MIGSLQRHAAREPGANPGRSRRCEGSSSAETTGLRAGKVAEGSPSQKTYRAAANPEPLAEGGFVFRRLITLAAAVTLVAASLPALAERVKVRVEGKTTTIFGSTEPSLTTGPNACRARCGQSGRRVLLPRQPGPFVNQIGRYPSWSAAGATRSTESPRRSRRTRRRSRTATRCSGTGRRSASGQHADAAPPASRQGQLLLGRLPERPGASTPAPKPCWSWTAVA